MTSKQSVITLYLMLVISTCDFESLPLEKERRQLSIPGLSLPSPPPCDTCVITGGAQLQGLTVALKDLGPLYKKIQALTGTVININATSVPDAQATLRKALQDAKDAFSPFFTKLSTAAGSVTSCPALQTLFDKFNKNQDALLTVYILNGPSFITATGLEPALDAFRKTLARSIPQLFTLIRDLIYGLLQVAVSALCPLLGPPIYFVFDPNGTAAQLVANFLNAGGSAVTSFVRLVFGNLIPGGKGGGALDQFGITTKLLCGLVGGAIPGSDIGEVTGGFCPPGSGTFDLFGFVKDVFCAFLGVVNPSSSTSGVCAPGSSNGGNSGLLGVIGGIACGVLNLLNLGGILGLCPGDGAKQVDFFIGLACEILKALSLGNAVVGVATAAFCPSG